MKCNTKFDVVIFQIQSSSSSSPGQPALELPKSRRKGEGDHISEGPSVEDPMKHQLNTYIKRVAELETRVEELTIRAEVCMNFQSHWRHKVPYSSPAMSVFACAV